MSKIKKIYQNKRLDKKGLDINDDKAKVDGSDELPRVIVVVGGTSGIGLETARQFSSLGKRVAIVGRDKYAIRNLPERFACTTHSIDVTNQDSVRFAFDDIMKKYGYADALIICSGYINPQSLKMMTDIDKHINVNLKGTLFCMQQFVHQLATTSSTIVTVSSSSGFKGRANWGAYCATKAAQISLMETAAEELEGTTKVYDVAPSRANTPMRERLKIDTPKELKEMNQPSDVAKLITWICSDKNLQPIGTSFWIENKIVKKWKKN